MTITIDFSNHKNRKVDPVNTPHYPNNYHMMHPTVDYAVTFFVYPVVTKSERTLKVRGDRSHQLMHPSVSRRTEEFGRFRSGVAGHRTFTWCTLTDYENACNKDEKVKLDRVFVAGAVLKSQVNDLGH